MADKTEKLIILVEADGTRTLKRELGELGKTGEQAGKRISASLRKALKDQAYNVRVAMNSTRLAEKFRVSEARAAAAEINRIRQQEARVAAEAARQQAQAARLAARTAAREQAAAARSTAQAARAAARQAIQAEREAARAAVAAARQAARDKQLIQKNELAAHRAALRARTAAERAAAREAASVLRAQRRQEAAERTRIREAKRDATLGLGPQLAAVASVYGVMSAVRSFTEYSDSMTNVNNRLKLVTKSTEELEHLTQALRQTALDSRSEFDLTTRSYARMAQATKFLELSQSSNLAMTETLTKAIAVSGATGAEAHATLIQLSQAMASNRLSADEFRSVSEQLPIILDLLADSTGRARTELKQMGEDGELTARTLALAILEGQDKIRKEFSKTTPTIEQAMENIRTQMRFTIDEFNKATGASESIVKALKWVAENLDTVAIAAKAVGTAISVYLVTEVASALKALATLAMANPWTAAAIGLAALIALIIQYRKEIQQTTIESDAAYFAVIQNTPSAMLTDEQKEAIRTGVTPGAKKRAIEDAADNYDMRTDASDIAAQEQDIASLKYILRPTQDKEEKKARGRHVTTFAEAIGPLLRENMALQVNWREREKLNTILDIQDKIKRSLLPKELQMVQAIYDQNKALKDQETILRSIEDMENERKFTHIGRGETAAQNRAVIELENELGRSLTDDEAGRVRSSARGLFRDQEGARRLEEFFQGVPEAAQAKDEADEQRLALRYRMRAGNFSGISSQEDFAQARSVLAEDRVAGDIDPQQFMEALESLEMLDEATPKIRKLLLEEINGLGEIASQLEGIFGPEGTLVKGFADATANAIVFGESFKKTINQLGKQIQAEIISTLIQGMIKMSVLGIMGGGEVSAGTAGALQLAARGPGRAAGGYAEGGRTRIAGYHHGGEFVVNAQGTQMNRPVLEAINKGGKANYRGSNGSRSSGGLNVTFIDNAGVSIETKQLSERDVQIIARREVNKEAPRVIAGSISDKNSHVNKSLRGHTNVRTQR